MWWLYVGTGDIKDERDQLLDEGKDISSIEAELEELAALDLDHDLSLQSRVREFYRKTGELPLREGYPYVEPSDLEGIKAERPAGIKLPELRLNDDELYDKILGAWLGRCSGCLLGKPVEGWRADRMWSYLKDIGRYPLDDYFSTQVPKEISDKYGVTGEFGYRPFIDRVDCMPEDDDTNYTVLGLSLLKKYGRDFTPKNVMEFWMTNLPILRTATAERVAYKNFVNLIEPPLSAVYCNPYREYIGAQIRADIFGYVSLGDPEFAAEMAFRDASISHVKNGIYGEMWVAAMLSAAAVTDDVKEIIKAGLSQIPERSRFSEAIGHVLDWHDEGIDYEEAVKRIHSRWDDHRGYHWCHVISNAQIVAVGLLWGDKDFGKSICHAVQTCFDTDCNGATVGSIVGMILGAEKLPERWIGPLNNTLETGVHGYQRVKITDLARETMEVFKKLRNQR